MRQAVKKMGSGMVERYGERPGRSFDHPAFTIRASAGGTEPHGFVWKEDMDETIKITSEEAATLQSYPSDYRFAGNKGSVGLQIGNAVPPLLAEAILSELWS